MIIKLCVWLASFRKPSLPPERSGEARVLARVGYACNANHCFSCPKDYRDGIKSYDEGDDL